MTFTKFHIFLLSVLVSLNVSGQNNNDSVFERAVLYSFPLTETIKNSKALLQDDGKPLRLFIFLSPECPLCKRYSPLLKELHGQFEQNVEFYGVVPGKSYSVEEVKKYGIKNNLAFPLLIDEDKKLSNYLQASATPEVILLNRNYEMIYKGAIDNLLVKLGKQRLKATENFLQEAISQSLANHRVTVKRTKAIGCRINDY